MSNYRLENYDTAAVYLQKAVDETQSPNLGDFYTQLALTLDKSEKFQEALAAYEQAYNLTESANLLFRMALIYDDELRNYDRAKELYQKYLQLSSGSTSNERLYAEDRLAEIKRADFMNVDD
jgi:tetratricopeptide (TPR) repeat protein